MKTIIVATDFSTEANNAMRYAAVLAQKMRSRIILFNSFQIPDRNSSPGLTSLGVNEEMKKNRIFLEKMALQLSEKHGIKVDCWSNLTFVAEGLKELVHRSGADLVVMGMWKKAEDDYLLGNTTTFVISQANFPVLVVPEDFHFTKIRKILFSWDPHLSIATEHLAFLKEFASGLKAKVQVLHVAQELTAFSSSTPVRKHGIEQAFEGLGSAFRSLENRSVIAGIERGIMEFGADLLVMVPHKPHSSDSIFYESRTREMALRVKVPLLTLPVEVPETH